MEIQKVENELKFNVDWRTKEELSDWGRETRRAKLRMLYKDYRKLLKKAWRLDEYEAYQEYKADMNREEEKLRAYDEREEVLNDVWLESYDLHCD